MENPFKYGGVVRGPYFADRQSELSELAREMKNLNRVFLVSPRRYRKTCLLANLLDRLEEEGLATAYLDLNACPDLRSFAAAFAQTTCRSLESNKDKLLKIFVGRQRMRPKVSVGADGSVSGSLEVVAGEKEALPAVQEGMCHAEALARKAKRKLAVVIDEFSDLEKYNGLSVEKALRAEIQQQATIGYIFSGSEESVMLSMVRDRKRAFYNTLWEKARESKKVTSSLVEELPFAIAKQDSPHFELLWHSGIPPAEKPVDGPEQRAGCKTLFKGFSTHLWDRAVFFHKGVSGIPGEERNPGQGQRWVLSILYKGSGAPA
jgi:hypothetical protein